MKYIIEEAEQQINTYGRVSKETAVAMIAEIARLRDQATTSVPDGWQLVPRQETKVMREVFWEQIDTEGAGFSEAYRMMLSFAPKWEPLVIN